MKSTPTRGVKQYLKPDAYNQSELDWTLMTISAMRLPYRNAGPARIAPRTTKIGQYIMADGTFAVLMLIAGLTDMSMNHCGSGAGCLGRSETAPRVAFSAGTVVERNAKESAEVYLRYDFGTRLGPFGQAAGLSLGKESGAWVGYGLTWSTTFGQSPFYTELHAMPGLYAAGDDFDLGGALEFRSGIEVGYENRKGWRYGLSYDHRSNAGIYGDNPGIETVQFRVSVPIR